MLSKINKALKNLAHGQKGMTGLETAIILIAFVTVASVLAYSVLSAGIFSSEKGKETVYKGLEQAQATMEISGAVLGLSANQTKLETVQLNVGLTIPNEKVDKNAVVINYWDDTTHAEGVSFTMALATGSTERGSASMLEGDEQFTITVTIPEAATIAAYDTFNLQVVPPTGAALTVKRTMPGVLDKVMNLN
ncbi:MAG: flagellin [Dehalococcoidales bacterium]|nr:flagellin [Dehalococcoidales bacterium]